DETGSTSDKYVLPRKFQILTPREIGLIVFKYNLPSPLSVMPLIPLFEPRAFILARRTQVGGRKWE
ncbi:MAG: hypothetical protein JSW28_01910, partial [Thermoplasmata archaeon]